MAYDDIGNVWVKTDAGSSNTGWEKIISASVASPAPMMALPPVIAEFSPEPVLEASAPVPKVLPVRRLFSPVVASRIADSAEPLNLVPQITTETPVMPEVKLSPSRRERLTQWLGSIKIFLLILPVLIKRGFFVLLCALFVSQSSHAGVPPPLQHNAWTTNVSPNDQLSGAVTTAGSGSIVTSLGSFSSAQLSGALTDETGNRLSVFSDDATMTNLTVNLGAATGLTLHGTTGGPGLTFFFRSGQPRITNSVTLDWIDFNAGLQLGQASGNTPSIRLDSDTGLAKFTGLTASRMVLTTSGQYLSSAAASGAVPLDADGTATTFPQVNALAPGYIVTNKNANAFNQIGNQTNSGTLDIAGATMLGGALNVAGVAAFANTVNAQGAVQLAGTTNFIAGNTEVVGGVYIPTNMTAAANFNKPMSWTNIGAAFTIAGPIGVDGTKTMGQSCIWQITNNTAAAVLVTAPANVHTYWFGTNCTGFYVTNYCSVLFQQYGGAITNAAVAFGF